MIVLLNFDLKPSAEYLSMHKKKETQSEFRKGIFKRVNFNIS